MSGDVEEQNPTREGQSFHHCCRRHHHHGHHLLHRRHRHHLHLHQHHQGGVGGEGQTEEGWKGQMRAKRVTGRPTRGEEHESPQEWQEEGA